MSQRFEDVAEKLFKVCQITKLKSEIDNFISQTTFDKKGLDKKQVEDKAIKIVSDFYSLSILLSEKFNIDKDLIHLYFSLDKDLFPKISCASNSYKVTEEVRITDVGQRNFYLSGKNVLTVYNRNYEKIISFLELNANNMPISTKKYILKKKSDLQKEAKMNFEKVTNDFECKLLINSLPEKFDHKLIKKYISKFSLIENKSDKALSFLNLLISLNTKYSNNPNEKFERYMKQLSKEFYNSFVNYVFSYFPNEEERAIAFKLVVKSFKYKIAIKLLAEMAIETNSATNTCYLISNFAPGFENQEKLDRLIAQDIGFSTYSGNFRFNDASEEIKKIIVEDSKRQWIMRTKVSDEISKTLIEAYTNAV